MPRFAAADVAIEGTTIPKGEMLLVGLTSANHDPARFANPDEFDITRDLGYTDPPPSGRIRFFAIAALAANVVFLMIVLLDGVASIVDRVCQQA